jgi:hypothetical protein
MTEQTPYIDDPELETHDTEPAGLKPVRDTQPPGNDPIEDPEHQKIVARLEQAMDKRFQQMAEHFAAELRRQLGPIANDVADHHETKRRLKVAQADIKAIQARLSHGNGTPKPPGE